MYDTILFPTDGSEETAVALEHAIDLARHHEATIDVLFAAGNGNDVDPEAVLEEAASTVRDRGVAINTVTLEGPPQDTIVDFALDRGVDVVVMGTHGRRGIDRYVEGSVTEQVLRNVTVPVLVVPMDPESSGPWSSTGSDPGDRRERVHGERPRRSIERRYFTGAAS